LRSNVEPSDQIAYLIQISELVRNYGLIIAAGFGVVLAWWRSRASNRQAIAALQQAELAQRNHVVEMFNRAVDQLGSEKLEVRLGAIYTLKRISRDPQYVDYRVPIWKPWPRTSGNGPVIRKMPNQAWIFEKS
jgi:hypothetical protein